MTFTLLLLALSLFSVSALPNSHRDNGAVLRLPVTAAHLNSSTATSKRQTAVPVSNIQYGTRYFVECKC